MKGGKPLIQDLLMAEQSKCHSYAKLLSSSKFRIGREKRLEVT